MNQPMEPAASAARCEFCRHAAVLLVNGVPMCGEHLEELRARAGGSLALRGLTSAEIELFGNYVEPAPVGWRRWR